MNDTILVLNCGSSSIKFALFDANVYPVPRQPLWAGKVDGIGSANASLAEPRAPQSHSPSPMSSRTTPGCRWFARPSKRERKAGCPWQWPTASCMAGASTAHP